MARAEAGDASAFAPGVEGLPVLDEDTKRCERLLRSVASRRSRAILTDVRVGSGQLPMLP